MSLSQLERAPLAIGGALVAAPAALLAAQLATGTSPEYALTIALFVVLAGLTVRVLGGLRTFAGLSVALLAAQHVVVSQVAKAVLGEPGDSGLDRPLVTAGVYALAMAAILFAAAAVRMLVRPRTPVCGAVGDPARLGAMATFALATALVRQILIACLGTDLDTGDAVVGGWLGPLKTMVFLPALAVAFATARVIVASGGRRSIDGRCAVAMAVPFAFGLAGAGRFTMLSGPVAYALTCFAYGFRFRGRHAALALLGAALCLFALFPYALYARNVTRRPGYGEGARASVELVTDLATDPYRRAKAQRKLDAGFPIARYRYYGAPMPTLERWSLIRFGDALIDVAERTGTTGWETVMPGLAMSLPRFVADDKPVYSTNNALGHRLPGLLAATDRRTQVAFGFVPESFCCFGWWGAFGLSFLLAAGYFAAYTMLFGSTLDRNPQAAALLPYAAWLFSESSVAATIVLVVQMPVVFAVTAGLLSKAAALVARPRRGPATAGVSATAGASVAAGASAAYPRARG